MCYLRGDCRPSDFAEPGIDENGSGAKHEKQEKVRGLIWARLLIPRNTIWFSARFVMEKGNYQRTLMSLMFAKNAEVLDSLRKKWEPLKKQK
jgi:hypothetical protein